MTTQPISIDDGAFFKGGIDICKSDQGEEGVASTHVANVDSPETAVAFRAEVSITGA
jgi:hypothetical protein